MDPSNSLDLRPETPLVTRPEWVRAGLGGVLCASPMAAAGVLGSYFLLSLVGPGLLHPLALLLWTVATPVLMSLPVAFMASRLARQAARSSPEEGAAIAAGTGFASALVAAAPFLMLSDSLAALGMVAPIALGAAFGVGLVGVSAFSELSPKGPWYRREIPALYVGLVGSGLAAVHLLFWSSLTWVSLSLLLPGFLAEMVRHHPSESFAFLSSSSLLLGLLAPVSFSSARTMARVRRKIPLPALAASVAAPLLVPLSMAFAGAWFLYSSHFDYLYSNWLAAGVGLALGSLPHLLGIYLGGTLGRRDTAETGPDLLE